MTGVGAWLRYGGPVRPEEVLFAINHYRVAILQPWEKDVATQLKLNRPDMTVLCYKCLSSTRAYENGPIYSSGVSYMEAEDAGGSWFVHRFDGSRVEWIGYPDHWQMNVCDQRYRDRWIRNVLEGLDGSPFDGIMADNDVYDDYYGLNLPVCGIASIEQIREAIDAFVHQAGRELNRIGKLFVPNIAESRREEGRWRSHSCYGGGFEEVWLGYDPEKLFDPITAEMQVSQACGPGLSILRVPTDGSDDHTNFKYGLAVFWIFGAGRGSFIATGKDDYNRTPYMRELDWSLGSPKSDPMGLRHVWSREFSNGWVAANMNRDGRQRRLINVPKGLVTGSGEAVPSKLVLPAQRGIILLKA